MIDMLAEIQKGLFDFHLTCTGNIRQFYLH